MALPRSITRFNRRYLNPLMMRLVGSGAFAELVHVGRRTGVEHRTVIMAFRSGGAVTFALTYGPDVDWLRNLRAAGGGRLRLGDAWLELGPPAAIATRIGLRRMPAPARVLLPLLQVRDFVELPVLGESAA